jgi:hypothetical protein
MSRNPGSTASIDPGASIDYAALPLSSVSHALYDVVRDTQSTFGRLTDPQLNWRPDARQWSVAQCFEHLLTTNDLMLRDANEALRNPGRSVWQRMPLLPAFLGRTLVRSQSPSATRKFRTTAAGQPSTSSISVDILRRFADQARDAAVWMESLDEGAATRTNMVSPFMRIIAYSVLDGCRLMVAHDRRHFEQARRVMATPGFPTA